MNPLSWIDKWRFHKAVHDPISIVRSLVENEFAGRLVLNEITFSDGTLLLGGDCQSIDAAHLLLCKVRRIKGIKRIKNQLKIVAPARL